MTDTDQNDRTVRPTLVRLEPREGLAAPGATQGSAARALEDRVDTPVSTGTTDDPEMLTGGGLVARLEPDRGIAGIWHEDRPFLGSVEIALDGRVLEPRTAFRSESGSWCGRYGDHRGRMVIERGVLPDVAAAAVFEWTLLAAAPSSPEPVGERPPEKSTLSVRLRDTRGELIGEDESQLGGGESLVLAIASGSPEARHIERLLDPLRARQRQRATRRGAREGELAIVIDGKKLTEVDDALRSIDDTSVTHPPTEKFLADVAGDPEYLEGEALAEFGLGALVGGRPQLSKSVIECLAASDDTPAGALLYLASRYALWTGDVGTLLPWLNALEAAAGKLRGGRSYGLLDEAGTLELLASAIEPLGERHLVVRLKARARELPAEKEAQSPPHAAVDSAPAALPPRPVRASRLLRSWIEGTLGISPDASYGRLRLAPQVSPSITHLVVSGVRTADATVRLEIHRRGLDVHFLLRQEGGRIPLNVVFTPWLPFANVKEVRLDDTPVEVTVTAETGGSVVRLQLPLDRDRHMVVSGHS